MITYPEQQRQARLASVTSQPSAVSQSTAGRVWKVMVDNGQIKKFGGSRTTRYELSKK